MTSAEWHKKLLGESLCEDIHKICAVTVPDIQAILDDGRVQGMREAVELASNHRQELFDDGIECDLHECANKVEAFIEGMVQERGSIADAIRNHADKLAKGET
jgi:hypothetical protein